MKDSAGSSPAKDDAAFRSPPEVSHFRLAGPTQPFDRRVHAARSDIADIALADRLFASHYARPAIRGCSAISAPLRAQPNDGAAAVSELLHGEAFAVVDVSGDWAWGYCRHDHYVGYLRSDVLGEAIAATHVVAVPRALLFARADIKSPVLAGWPMGARLAGSAEGEFVRTAAGFVHRRHVAAIEERAKDPVAIAERLIGAPYHWGGRSGDGPDCSGLVQLTLAFAGIAAPRDSDQQADAIGAEISEDEALRRGDLVFFPGHVGMMADAEHIVHANAYWMAVSREPLADVVARLQPAHEHPITARRRVT